jgi:hypothetical protein
MRFLWIALSSIGIVLQLMIIAAMLRGAAKVFRVLFVYVVILFWSTVLEASAFYSAEFFRRASRYYWAIDAVRNVLIFLLVFSLIDRALETNAQKARMRRLLWSAAALFVVASVFLTRDPRLGFWMTSLSRNLGFLAAVLNLVLWAVLSRFHRVDQVLLMVSGGMGIQMAGKAIGHSLRQISPVTLTAGNIILVTTHILCLYIWWIVFRRYGEPAVNRT